MATEKQSDPADIERMAWATMVVGEMSSVIHDEPGWWKQLWPRISKQERRILRSYTITQELFQHIKRREERR